MPEAGWVRSGQRTTLPALMHDVQTLSRLGLPATMARTRWIFGFQRRLVFFFDQGTLWPNPGLLPHTSHTAATGVLSQLRSVQVSMPDVDNRKRVPDRYQRRPIAHG
jgi:hypothetical protein